MEKLKSAFPNSTDRYVFMVFSVVCGVFFLLFCVWFLPYIFIDEFASFDVVYDGDVVKLDERSAESLRKADVHPWSSITLSIQNASELNCDASIAIEGGSIEKFDLAAGSSWGSFGERMKTTVTVCGQAGVFDFSSLKKSIFD